MNWRIILRSFASAEMRKKIFAVLGMLIVFRFLAHIPIPLAEPAQLKQVLDNIFNQASSSQLTELLRHYGRWSFIKLFNYASWLRAIH